MRYQALATDYDGTLADGGSVSESTFDSLRRLRASGRRLIMVTGRRLEELLEACPNCEPFEWIVAENGAVSYSPATNEIRPLASPPPPEFAAELRRRGVAPLEAGHVIVATREPHGPTVSAAIRDLGLDLHIIPNKGAVMILPAGVTKAEGLQAVADSMGIALPHVVGIGDAENDVELLRVCGYGVAVANAVSALKQQADYVTSGEHGAGVSEVIEMLLADDLASVRETRSS